MGANRWNRQRTLPAAGKERKNRNRRNSHGQKQAERLYAGRACRGHCDHGHFGRRRLGGVLGLCEKGERGGGLTASRRGEHGVCIRVLRCGAVRRQTCRRRGVSDRGRQGGSGHLLGRPQWRILPKVFFRKSGQPVQAVYEPRVRQGDGHLPRRGAHRGDRQERQYGPAL